MAKIDFSEADFSALKPIVPSHDDFFAILERTTDILESEYGLYRPKSASDSFGGLLDFRESQERPLIIVPDLHARHYFLQHILSYKLSSDFLQVQAGCEISVLSALKSNLVRLICVGDALHSESRGKDRWNLAWEEFVHEDVAGKAMMEEMGEGLALISLVMKCKCLFPENFHFLKGNHENIENNNDGNDYGFYKFVQEGLMTRRFITEYYGDDILYLYSCFEHALPLAAIFPNCIVSHAEPKRAYSYEEIRDCWSKNDVIFGLTWTANDEACDGSVQTMLDAFTKNPNDSTYFTGHRPVSGKYAYRQDKKLVQIHNPDEENIALVYTNRKFNPDSDIVSVV